MLRCRMKKTRRRNVATSYTPDIMFFGHDVGHNIVSEVTMSYIDKIYRYDIVYNVHDIVILNGTTSCPRHTMSEVYDVFFFSILRHRMFRTRCRTYEDTTSGICHDVVSEDTTSPMVNLPDVYVQVMHRRKRHRSRCYNIVCLGQDVVP